MKMWATRMYSHSDATDDGGMWPVSVKGGGKY